MYGVMKTYAKIRNVWYNLDSIVVVRCGGLAAIFWLGIPRRAG